MGYKYVFEERDDSPPAAPPQGIKIYTTTKLQESFNQNISPKIIKRKLQVFYEVRNYMFPIFTLVPDTENPHKGDLSTSKTPVDLDKQAFEGERWGKWGRSPSAGSPSTHRRRRSWSRSRTNGLKKRCYDRADYQPTTSCFSLSKFQKVSRFILHLHSCQQNEVWAQVQQQRTTVNIIYNKQHV